MQKFELAGNAVPTVDPRDHDYISPFMPEELPKSLDLRWSCVGLVNQLAQGACVANGNYFDLARKIDGDGGLFIPSRQFMHNSTKVLGGYVGQYGVYIRDALQALSTVGVCQEHEYPYLEEANNTIPSPETYALAKPNLIADYEAVIPVGPQYTEEEKVHRVCSALNEGMIVGLGIRVTDSIFSLKGHWTEHKYQVEDAENPAIGRHYMYIVGYDMELQMFLLANWWGQGHGDKGYTGLPFSVVNSLRPEAWCIRYFKGVGTPERSGIFKNLLTPSAFSARLQVPDDLIGTTTNIWAGAVLPNGQALIKHNQGDDSWLPIEQGVVPFLTDYPLKKINLLSLVTYQPNFTTDFAGAEFYAGYGKNVFLMAVNKVWTI
jgi:hypothetical protein